MRVKLQRPADVTSPPRVQIKTRNAMRNREFPNQRGAGAVEYALVIATLVLLVVGVAGAMKGGFSNFFGESVDCVDGFLDSGRGCQGNAGALSGTGSNQASDSTSGANDTFSSGNNVARNDSLENSNGSDSLLVRHVDAM